MAGPGSSGFPPAIPSSPFGAPPPTTPNDETRFRLHPRSLAAASIPLIGAVIWSIAALAGRVDFDIGAGSAGIATVVWVVRVVTTEVTVTDGEVRWRWGWLWHIDKTIPVQRVQEVQIERSLLARILQLTQVEISSAGGAGSIKLSYLDLPTAERLRALLAIHGLSAASSTGGPSSSGGPAGARPVYSVSPAEIVRTQYASIAFAIVITGVSVVVAVTGTLIALLGVILAVALVAIGGLSTWLAYGPGESSISGPLLHLRQGVIRLRATNTPLVRVQLFRSRRGPVYQLLHYEKIQYASADASEPRSEGVRQVLAPAARSGALTPIASAVLGVQVPEAESLNRFGPLVRVATIARAVEAGVLRLAGTLVLAGFGVGVARLADAPAVKTAMVAGVLLVVHALIEAILVALAALVGTTRNHRSRYGWGVDCLVVRDGFLRLETKVLPLGKIQAVSVQRSPGQRIVGAATVSIDVAGASGKWSTAVVDLTTEHARSLAGHLITAACTSALPDGV